MNEGEKLKLAIRGTGLSQIEAAKKLEISRTTLNNYFLMDALSDEFVQNVQKQLGIDIKANNSDFVQIQKEGREHREKTNDELTEMPIPDPQAPGIYQEIIRELIESSKAQRRISEVLLEERQLIRDTAQATINLVSSVSKTGLAEVGTSLNTLQERADETDAVLDDLEKALVFGLAEALKKKPEEIETRLHTGDWGTSGKSLSKKKIAGN